MRAHTITTRARGGGKGRRKRTIAPLGILALSLAVVVGAATASTASTTPTAPTPPEPGATPELTLDLDAKKQSEIGPCPECIRLEFFAEANEDATMTFGGGVKTNVSCCVVTRSPIELKGGNTKKVKAFPKNRIVNKLAETGKAKVIKIRAEAVSESGATDTDQVTMKLTWGHRADIPGPKRVGRSPRGD